MKTSHCGDKSSRKEVGMYIGGGIVAVILLLVNIVLLF